MLKFVLRCSECGAAYREGPAVLLCDECSRRQEPGGPLRGVLSVQLLMPPERWPSGSLSSPDALAQMLPVHSAGSFPSFPAGGTPLLPVPNLRQELRLPSVWVKDDTRNPSGSTKDRASLLVVAKAREYGLTTVATASTGNAATALAACGAAAGLSTVVFVPAKAPTAKLVQMASYGARLIPVDGTYDQAFDLSVVACERFGWYNRNTALNPFTIEGKKTAALEIARDLRNETPDVVIVPTGDGVILAGLAKGFSDLVAWGLAKKRPRLIAVQPEGSGALARALRSHATTIEPVPNARSVADSLVVGAPRNALLAIREVLESGGTGVLVSDEAILDAQGLLARTTGVFAEPAGAAALAGLLVALEEKVVWREERIVLLVTGTGLKDVAAAARRLSMPAAVPPTIEAVEALMRPPLARSPQGAETRETLAQV